MALNSKVVFELPGGEECPIRLEDVEVEAPLDSTLGTRLSVGTCFRAKGCKYRVSKVYTKLHMDDIIASLDGAERSAKVHVYYIIDQMEEN